MHHHLKVLLLQIVLCFTCFEFLDTLPLHDLEVVAITLLPIYLTGP